MKKKRTEFLGGVATICWVVGVLLVGIFLSMTAVYATCNGTFCDIYDPPCGTTFYYKPNGSVAEGCFSLAGAYSGSPAQGFCNGSGDYCNTCLCRPEKPIVSMSPCQCRE